MKKLFLLSVLLFTVTVSAQAPNRLFDVRSGNGIVDNGIAQPVAWYIVFQDAAAQQKVIDAICEAGNYDSLNPATRPTKNAFARNEIKNHIKDAVKLFRAKALQNAVPAVDEGDLPPQ